MLRQPAHFIFYLSMLQKPAAVAGFCNILKYKADNFYLSTDRQTDILLTEIKVITDLFVIVIREIYVHVYTRHRPLV